jgi:hypothetical protein
MRYMLKWKEWENLFPAGLPAALAAHSDTVANQKNRIQPANSRWPNAVPGKQDSAGRV